MNKRQAKKKYKHELMVLNLLVEVINQKDSYTTFGYWDSVLMMIFIIQQRKGSWRYLCTEHYDKICIVGSEYEFIRNELLDEKTNAEFQKFVGSKYGAE